MNAHVEPQQYIQFLQEMSRKDVFAKEEGGFFSKGKILVIYQVCIAYVISQFYLPSVIW